MTVPTGRTGAAGIEPSSATNGVARAFLATPFRPFFLLAQAHSAIALPIWLAMYQGLLPGPGHLGALGWHRHEMLFGFAAAVIAGFLLTAARNWTGRRVADGRLLASLVLLWLAGRLVPFTGGVLPTALVAAIDIAFPLAIAAVLLPALAAARNWRNLGFVAVLAAFAAALLAGHLGHADRAVRIALDLVLILLVVMGGRVIPAFTRNALPDAGVRRFEWMEWPAIVAVLVLPILALADAPPAWQGSTALAAALANVLRMATWQSLATRKLPILWILHLGYGWIVVALLLRGLAWRVLWIPEALALHALAIGAIGSLTLGMMTRVARGHTGRPLAVSKGVALAYGLVNLAALVRVAMPLVLPKAYLASVVLAGALWSAAFALTLASDLPILIRPRIDGRSG